ncbi:hypothetical protein FA048_12375 [Pedobacter polaris]|uniref:DUF5683 domain-containing protein n=1 Tax=Pedobacter polaris TaxID=2571273 RepID=A0A4V5NZC1_9SPHI|nr:DUF5683 domain-containing protein [Pedobacter polaris]TKC07955.1 hypothetical protein FA048_12375 [Pedobacter polaris]
MRSIFLLIVTLLTFATAKAQNPVTKKPADTTKEKLFVDSGTYVNQGKIAAHKAAMKSLIFPGLGQMYNYGLVVDDVKNGRVKGKRIAQKLYIIGKTAAIYAGGTILVMSYIDNREQYKRFLTELQYRQANGDKPDPNGNLAQYTNTPALTVAKNIYKRNSQVVLISLVGIYGLNVLDAYVTTRLKYFNIDETLSIRIAPSLINSNTMYGYSAPAAPALKLTLKL